KIGHEKCGGKTPAIKMVPMVFLVSETMSEISDKNEVE
ncbi:hypothetical protein EVAR_54918_1, partial [Eumeta japonica]